MNAVKQQITRLFRGLGYEVIPRWLLPDYEKAKLLESIFAFHRIDSVVDVGGNTGQYRDFIRRDVGYQGPIVTFEPITALAEKLTARAKSERDLSWTIEGYALGQVEQKRDLNVTRDSAFTSFLKPKSEPGLAPGSTGFEGQMNVAATQPTQIKRLDAVLPKLLSPFEGRRVFLKIDTQGYDLEVLAGASGALPAVAAIQVEVSFIPIYEGMPHIYATLDELKRLGFHVSGLFSIARDKHLRAIEFDCVLVR